MIQKTFNFLSWETPAPEFRGACQQEGFPAGGGESMRPKTEGSLR